MHLAILATSRISRSILHYCWHCCWWASNSLHDVDVQADEFITCRSPWGHTMQKVKYSGAGLFKLLSVLVSDMNYMDDANNTFSLITFHVVWAVRCQEISLKQIRPFSVIEWPMISHDTLLQLQKKLQLKFSALAQDWNARPTSASYVDWSLWHGPSHSL